MPSIILPMLLLEFLAPHAAARHEPTTTPAQHATLAVEVADLRSRKGDLRLGVFNSPRGFPRERDGAILWKTMPAKSEETVFTLALPPGEYAVVVLHDENSNKKLDTNFLGIPKEGYGVSNNPKPKRRAARFDESVFSLPEAGANVTVSIQYF